MWFYKIGTKVDIYGRKGTIETQPRPYWYGVMMDDTGKIEEFAEGAIKAVKRKERPEFFKPPAEPEPAPAPETSPEPEPVVEPPPETEPEVKE